MSLRIIYGESGTGKTDYIFNEIAENIDNGIKKYIIVPEQFSFSAEKELLNKIELKKGRIASLEAEVLSFNRMSYRAISESGQGNNIVLQKSGKAMIIMDLLEKNKSELEFLGKNIQNIDVILNEISEFKRHGVSKDDLFEVKEKIKEEDKYLYKKLDEIYTIYEKYENIIEEKYLDTNDSMSILVNNLDNISDYDNKEIYIDEFVGFTKQEYKVIESLLRKAKRVTISLCMDNFNINNIEDGELFYSSKVTAKRLVELAKDINVEIENTIEFKEKYRFKNKELRILSDNLYKNKIQECDKENIENIKIFLANDKYSEIESIAKEIIKLVRDEKYSYKDIGVVTKNIDVYDGVARSIFSKYNIPIYIDNKKDLNQNIIIKYVLGLLDIFNNYYSRESIIDFLKIGLLDIDYNDIYLLENYTKKWNIKGNKWYPENVWNYHDEKEVGIENIEKLNTLKIKIMEPILKLRKELDNSKTVKDICNSLYENIIENNINENIEKKIQKLLDLGLFEKAQEYKESYNILIDVFDEMVEIFGDEKISFDRFINLFKVAILNKELGTIPNGIDEVVFGDIDRSRSHKIKVLFIIGVNDGVFPSENRVEGFINDKDREKLKSYDIELAKDSTENIYEDTFNIYKAFTIAENKLYISYLSSDTDGKSLRPSTILLMIKNIFKNLKEDSDVVVKKTEIVSKNRIIDELLMNIRNDLDGIKIDEKWYEIYHIIEQDNELGADLKDKLEAINYTNLAKKISKENVDELYGNKLYTSISKLETYRRCPYKYFINYNLKLKEEEKLEVRNSDTGSILHDIIDRFFTFLDDNNLNIKELEKEKIYDIINLIIEEEFNLEENYKLKVTPKYIHLTNRLKNLIKLAMEYIIDGIVNSDFNVLGHEIDFSDNGDYEPIKIKLDNGKEVDLVGKIDRADITKIDNETYVRIIDYKSSAKNLVYGDVQAGLQIQLLTYLNELCKKEDFEPAATLYFSMKDPSISNCKDIEDEIRKSFKMKGAVVLDVKVLKAMDHDLDNGVASKIIPAKLNGDGSAKKDDAGLSTEQFNNLKDYMDKITKEISNEILSGKIDINPVYHVSGKNTECEYCNYKSICLFNVNQKGNKYNVISSRKKDDVLEEIRQDMEKEKGIKNDIK